MTKLSKQTGLEVFRHSASGLSRIAWSPWQQPPLPRCRPDHAGPEVAGWTLIEPTERHPILVSQQPETMTIAVRRGSYGLSQWRPRDRVARFLQQVTAQSTPATRSSSFRPRAAGPTT